MKDLKLSLIRKWFNMTKTGVKTEDYREITAYWCNRLLLFDDQIMGRSWWAKVIELQGIDYILANFKYEWFSFRHFDTNTMTLGYPKLEDKGRTLKYKHEGIEIREGNAEWGAEEGVKYFCIMHGEEVHSCCNKPIIETGEIKDKMYCKNCGKADNGIY